MRCPRGWHAARVAGSAALGVLPKLRALAQDLPIESCYCTSYQLRARTRRASWAAPRDVKCRGSGATHAAHVRAFAFCSRATPGAGGCGAELAWPSVCADRMALASDSFRDCADGAKNPTVAVFIARNGKPAQGRFACREPGTRCRPLSSCLPPRLPRWRAEACVSSREAGSRSTRARWQSLDTQQSV